MPITDIVNAPGESKEDGYAKEHDLAAWVLSLSQTWEETRDTNNRSNWARYERIWRGIFSTEDKHRKSERSQHISPALSQAVESIVAEVEEAVFGAGHFFDVDKTLSEQDRVAVQQMRDLLFEDMEKADIQTALVEIVLNGAIYGTGIGKIVIETVKNKYITPKPVDGMPDVVEAGREEDEEVVVRLVPVHNFEFIIDDSAKNLTDAMGMVHVTIVPMHKVKKKQRLGIYNPDACIEPYNGTMTLNDSVTNKAATSNGTKIYEYHGLIPSDMMARHVLGDDYEALIDPESDEYDEEDDMMEAIVTITDGGELLRAIPNPNTLQDRNFVAFQFDVLPNQFYGRGVCEKGINAQTALDKETRARHDAMALTVHPMMAVDASRLPRGADVRVRPGRTLLSQGNPRETFMPMTFGTIDPSTFTQTADLERQVAKATGALDDNAMNPAHAKTGAMGMAMTTAVKRSRRALMNFERNIVAPTVHKFAHRYMQFAPDRYPVVANPKFKVHTSKGIVAKQMESMELGNMLKTVTPDSPAYWMLLKGIYENSTIDDREAYIELAEQRLQAALDPQPTQAEIADMEFKNAKLGIEKARGRAELLRIELEARKLESGTFKDMTQSILNLAKAESEEAGASIDKYNAVLQRIKAQYEMKRPEPVQQESPDVQT